MIEYVQTLSVLSSSEVVHNFVINIVNHFVSRKKRMIIITMRNEMTDCLYEALMHDSVPAGRNTKKYVVEYLNTKHTTCGNCDVLLGTHKKLGTGFDERNSIVDFQGEVASVLLFLGSIKDKTLMYQVAGRVFRSDEPLVIFPLMADVNFSHSHTNSLKEMIESEMKECEVCEETTQMIQRIAMSAPIVRR